MRFFLRTPLLAFFWRLDYASCLFGEWKAHEVLKGHLVQDVVSWSALIAGYAEHGHSEEALNCFESMQMDDDVFPNAITLVFSLKACSTLGAIVKGQEIHAHIEKRGFIGGDLIVGNTIVDMYATCGCLPEAHQIFDRLQDRDIISWGAIMAGYMEHGQCQRVINLYSRMQDEDFRHEVDRVILMNLLGACSGIGDIRLGRKIHDQVMLCNDVLLFDDVDVGNAFVNMYVKCGSLKDAQRMFDHIPTRNLVAWGAMIAGYVTHGDTFKAFQCFKQMQEEGVITDAHTLVYALQASANLVGKEDFDVKSNSEQKNDSEIGKALHAYARRKGFTSTNIFVVNTIIGMYGKCGAPGKAQKAFEELPERNVVSWTSIIGSYSREGLVHQAMECF